MSSDPRIEKLLTRLLAMPTEQLDALLPAAPTPTTPTGTIVTGQVGAPQLEILPPTPATARANSAQLVSPPVVRNVTFVAPGLTGVPRPSGTVPAPPPPPSPHNSHVVGSLKSLAFPLPEVTHVDLLPY